MFKVIRGQKFRKKSGYGKLKLNGLHRDHLPAISKRPVFELTHIELILPRPLLWIPEIKKCFLPLVSS